MKKIIIGMLILSICVMCFGCSPKEEVVRVQDQTQVNTQNQTQPSTNTNTQTQQNANTNIQTQPNTNTQIQENNNQHGNNNQNQVQQSVEPTDEATLYVNMYTGSETAVYDQYPLGYSGQLTPEMLAEGLTSLTGYQFIITTTWVTDGIIVDWSRASAMFDGYTDPNDGFFVYDVESLTYLMFDSMWRTLTNNLGIENVYYTMDGGKELDFGSETYLNIFPIDSPYMGSAFYYAHSDNVGDLEVTSDIEKDIDIYDYVDVNHAFDVVAKVVDQMNLESTALEENGYCIIDNEYAVIIVSGLAADSQDGDTTILDSFAVTESGKVYSYNYPNEEWYILNR